MKRELNSFGGGGGEIVKIEVEINCCLCLKKYKTKIELPDGWAMRYGGISEDNGFCPEHKKVQEFAEAQCSGCVGGWGDCSLWSAFAYSGRKTLTEEDFRIMRTGRCPKRTNGTLSFNSETREMKKINLSEVAESGAGIALEKAIKDYWKRYPEEK